MLKLIICDLDDTLAPEMAFVKSGYKVCAKELAKHCPLSADEIVKISWELFYESKKEIFNRALQKIFGTINEALLKTLIDLYRTHSPDIEFYPDVLPFIEKARSLDMKLAIITDGFAATQKAKIAALNAEKLFDKIIATGELGADYAKPSRKSFDILREYFKIDFSDMLYIGDNPRKDFYISKTIPIKTARIVRADSIYKNEPYLEGHRENISINNLLEIIGDIA